MKLVLAWQEVMVLNTRWQEEMDGPGVGGVVESLVLQMETQHKSVPVDKQATEFLANERTFLAWIRTSVAIISLGFEIAKFRIWLQDIAKAGSSSIPPSKLGESFQIGIGMMALGGFLTILAAWRYHAVNRQIEKGKVTADRGLIFFVTILVAVLAAVMVVTMIATSRE